MTTESSGARRRSPGWLRALSDRGVHAVAQRAHHKLMGGEETSQTARLFDCCISELEYRARRDARDGMKPCSCQWCCPPFPEQWPMFDDDPSRSESS